MQTVDLRRDRVEIGGRAVARRRALEHDDPLCAPQVETVVNADALAAGMGTAPEVAGTVRVLRSELIQFGVFWYLLRERPQFHQPRRTLQKHAVALLSRGHTRRNQVERLLEGLHQKNFLTGIQCPDDVLPRGEIGMAS